MNVGRVNQVLETYQAQQLRRTVQSRGNLNTDRVEISREAREFEQAKKLAAGISEIREDKIAAAEAKMTNGALNIPAPLLAAKMLGIS